DGSGGDELVRHPQFAYAHGHQGVAGGVTAENGDVAGESSGCHAPDERAEESADVAWVGRARRRISGVLAATRRMHDDVATCGQCCGGVLLDGGSKARVVAVEQLDRHRY